MWKIKTIIIVGILLLSAGSSINFLGRTEGAKSRILYVGGTGPGNYTKIQDAINDATNGDTIFVYKGVYHENIVIRKQIRLIGEDKSKTVICGKKPKKDVIQVYAAHVSIEGLTIKSKISSRGIVIRFSHHDIIKDNLILDSSVGILLTSSSYNIISNNTISGNTVGIKLLLSCKNDIHRNCIDTNALGISLSKSNGNKFCDNCIENCTTGIMIRHSKRNEFHSNIIAMNLHGVILSSSSNMNIFISNYFDNLLFNVWIRLRNVLNKFYRNAFNNSYFLSWREILEEISNTTSNLTLPAWIEQIILLITKEPAPSVIDSGYNIWFDRISSTGNYWWDYKGDDKNGDGIGDRPYIVKGISIIKKKDRYPLMKNPLNIELHNPEILSPNLEILT